MSNRLSELYKSYHSAVNSNEEAVKILMEINQLVKEKEKEDTMSELNRKIKLLNIRTRVIISQINKKLKDIEIK